jgi:hypothetical protein
MPFERDDASAIPPRSDWSISLFFAEWKRGDSSLPGFDNPTDAVHEHGTDAGDKGKAVERGGAIWDRLIDYLIKLPPLPNGD